MARRPYRRDTPPEEWIRAGQESDLELPLPGPDGKPSETLKMRFRRVPAGSFLMGSREGRADEEPPHRVEVAEFCMGKFVVTQEEWAAVAGLVKWNEIWPFEMTHGIGSPREMIAGRLPVTRVSYDDVQAWIRALNQWIGGFIDQDTPGIKFRLPDEAEWEYACRAETRTDYWSGDGEAALARVGWFALNSGNEIQLVDHLPATASTAHPLGLVGLHGNSNNWCADAYEPGEGRGDLDFDIHDPDRVTRGGAWNYGPLACRAAARHRCPIGRFPDTGFRLCCMVGLVELNRNIPSSETAPSSIHESENGGRQLSNGEAGLKVQWESRETPGFLDWSALARLKVERLILGSSPKVGEGQPLHLTPDQAAELREWVRLQSGLRSLHLWNVGGIDRLASMPEGLECLDIRHCPDLQALDSLPASLEFLWLDGCKKLARVPAFPVCVEGLPFLEELSLKGCENLPESAIHGLVRSAPDLRWLDASGCPELKQVPRWPPWLERVELNDCVGLLRLPETWPDSLRRVGLRNAIALESMPDFVTDPAIADQSAIDWLDLRGTTSLRKLPAIPWSLRTLYLFGSGVPLAPELFGDTKDANVAPQVIAFLRQDFGKPRVVDNEIKVILLGNGRCGKTSLARRWIENRFDPKEPSTHGVHHWRHRVWFEPVDGGEPEEVVVHVWDFAGQDLYHNTHRLFFQSRAVFVICGADQVPPPDPDEPDDALAEPHPVEYWLDQVRSLGNAPGMEGPPPVLLVRTQAAKSSGADYWGKVPADAMVLPQVDFESGSEEAGFRERFEAHLQHAVARVLGVKERREYPESVLALKREISALLEQNDVEYRAAEKEGRPARSPHPTMSRAEFDALATRLCPGYPVDRLIELLHRSGFLFYPGERLPEVVILDQRWATDALYILTERGSAMREHLVRHRGIVTARDMDRLAWSLGPTRRQPHRVRYSPEEQRLFRSFMEECGMCFELVPARLARGDESVYTIPGFLPKAEDRTDLAEEWWSSSWDAVPESAAQSATVYLGRYWRRSALLWRWGGRVAAAKSLSVLEVNWERRTPEAYTGTLGLRFLGTRDPGFAVEVVEELARSVGFEEPDGLDVLRAEVGRRGLGVVEEATEDGPGGPRMTAKPTEAESVGTRVGFSYAGDTEARPYLGTLVSRAGEMLEAWMKEQGRAGEVLDYGKEAREWRLGRFLDQIAKADLAVMFWSRPYWESPYCLAEAVMIREPRLPEGFGAKDVVVFVVGGERIGSGATGEGGLRSWNHGDFEKYWKQKAEDRLRDAREKHGDLEAQVILKRDAFDAWYQVVQSSDRWQVVRDFLEYRIGNTLEDPVDADTAERQARQVFEVLTQRMGLDAGAE